MEPDQSRRAVMISLASGGFLSLSAILLMIMTVSEWGPAPGYYSIEWVFIPMFLLSGTILIFAIFMASGHRLADKAPYVITGSLILMIPFSYLGTPDTSDFLGSDRAWAVIMGFCYTLICGGISFLPMLLSGPNSEEVTLEKPL